jgi:hypothetical protein
MQQTVLKALSWKSIGLVGLLLAIVALFSAPQTQAARQGAIQNASQDAANSLLPRTAQDPDGNLHVVWDTEEEGSRLVRWRKGVWNSSTSGYDFGPSIVFADVGGFQYSTPNIAVAPNGTVLAAWSNGFQIYVRQWNMRDAQPSGDIVQIMPGFDASIAVDGNSRFHIVSNGDFQVQYCEWNGSSCAKRDSFSRDLNANPDIAVDTNNNIHVVMWGRGGIRYRYRPAGQEWGTIETIAGGGNASSIAADGQGAVHIVWSQDYDIQYCRKTGAGCVDKHTFDGASDLSPSIGATRSGNLVVMFYDNQFRRLWYSARENGGWSATQDIANAPTRPDLTAQAYAERISGVWSVDYDISLATVIVGAPAPTPVPPTPTPQPTPSTPAPPTGVFDFGNSDFRSLWTRTDSLVARGAVNYSWIWGPAPFTQAISEPYVQSPGGQRTVQYLDKSRMEINQPGAPRNQFYVSNGRLTDELITGQLQVGDAQYQQRSPAAIAVAGDPQNTFPLYRDLQAVYRRQRSADHANEFIARGGDGSVQISLLANANNDPSMLIVQREAGLGIPKVFWDFMNRPGQVSQGGGIATANPLIDWRYVIGEPLTEAYWTVIKVGGQDQAVLMQAFERRVLTFTPSNAPTFQVEMGNIGRHYFEWRYGVRP